LIRIKELESGASKNPPHEHVLRHTEVIDG